MRRLRMTSYTKESNDLKRSVIQTKCKETREETNEFMGWASQISKLNENTAFNLYTLTVKDRPQAVDNVILALTDAMGAPRF